MQMYAQKRNDTKRNYSGCNCDERMKSEQQPFNSVIIIGNNKKERRKRREERSMSETFSKLLNTDTVTTL